MSDSNRRITRDQAMADYLAMGPKRSLAKLARRYSEARAENGTLGNLSYWSRQHGWVERAREHDAQVRAETSRLSIEGQAHERWDLTSQLNAATLDLLGTIKGLTGKIKVTTLEEMATIVDMAVVLSQQALKIHQGLLPDDRRMAAMADRLRGAVGSKDEGQELLRKQMEALMKNAPKRDPVH